VDEGVYTCMHVNIYRKMCIYIENVNNLGM